MAGYIKCYRDLRDNPIWQDKPFSKGQAWIDIIFRCNHICNKVTGYGKCDWVLRGQFISSNYKLAESWGWSESSVRAFIKLLESENMLTKKSFSKYTLYEVTNYCVYQSVDTEVLQENSNAQKTRKKRTENAQKTPNNNDNNEKNEKKVIKKIIEIDETIIENYTNDLDLKEAIRSFIDHREVKKKPLTNNSLKLMLIKLDKLSSSNQTKTDILNESVISGWLGIFPLKNQNQSNEPSKKVSNGNVFLEMLRGGNNDYR